MSDDPPLGEYLDEWLDRRVSQLRPTSLREYRNAIDRYLKPELRTVRLSELDRRTLERSYAHLLTAGGHNGKSLSPKTVSHAHSILHGALKDAVLDGLLDANPAAHARRPTRDPGETEIDQDLQIWTIEQVAHFLDEVDDHPLRAVWHLAVGTGARRGEVLGLRWCDVDLEDPMVHIRRSLSIVGGVARLLGTKTSRNRKLSIGRSVVDALAREREEQDARRRAAGRAWSDEWGLVFTDETGAPLVPMDASIGLPHDNSTPRPTDLFDRPGTLRVTSLEQGAPIKLISERLGHSSYHITMDTYAHLMPAMDQEAIDQFDAALHACRRT